MRWMAPCLPVLLLAAGCSTYNSSGVPDTGDEDAGADAAMDGGRDAGADMGGSDPGSGDFQGDDDTCRANPPQTVGLQIGDDPWGCIGCSGEAAGPVQVLFSHSADAGGWVAPDGSGNPPRGRCAVVRPMRTHTPTPRHSYQGWLLRPLSPPGVETEPRLRDDWL